MHLNSVVPRITSGGCELYGLHMGTHIGRFASLSSVLVLAVFFLGTASAEPGALQFGAWAGAGASWLSFPSELKTLTFEAPIEGDVLLKEKPRPVLVGGVYLLVHLGAGFSLEPGASLSMRGGKLHGKEALSIEGAPAGITAGIEYTEVYKLSTVNFAILLRHTSRRTAGTFYVGAGPEFNYVFYSKFESAIEAGIGGLVPDGFVNQMDAMELTHPLSLGALFETGVTFPQKSYSIVLQLRFGFGLTNVYKVTNAAEPKIRHRDLTLSIGLMR
jgi:hypothetical protein